LENKVAGETYLVSTEVASVLGSLARPVELYAAIDRQNNPFLIPIPLPGPNGVRNPWHESLAQAVERAKVVWLRISANKDLGGYDIYEATAKLPDPVWPDITMDELLEIAEKLHGQLTITVWAEAEELKNQLYLLNLLEEKCGRLLGEDLVW
jgi:hypothetical protein